MPLPGVTEVASSQTNDILYAILNALGGGSGSGGVTSVEVAGTLADIGGNAITNYSDKRYIAFEWLYGATGIVEIDGVTFTPNDMLPVFPNLGIIGHHRTITVNPTACTGLLINFIDKA